MSSLKKFSPVIVLSVLIIATLVVAGFLIQETLAQSKAGPMHLAKLPCFEDGSGPGPVPICGNGIKEAGEACDDEDFGGLTCMNFGSTVPEGLICIGPGQPGECTIDNSGCNNCGNGNKEGTEECDGLDFGATSTDCADHFPSSSGVVSCFPAGDVNECKLDLSACATCGDSLCVPLVEECDDMDYCGTTCASVGGYPERTPGCFADCTIDLCPCGDVIEYDEVCYGADFCDGMDKDDCEAVGCTWTPDPAPSPSPSPAESETGTCTGTYDCSGFDYEECGDVGSCTAQRPIKCCWGPKTPCGYAEDLEFTNSGMYCSYIMDCEGFEAIYARGNWLCYFNENILIQKPGPTKAPEDDIYYMIEFDNVSSEGAKIFVRKCLVELPID